MSVQTKIRTFGGNVGIGTDDPGTYRLKVVGGGTRVHTLIASSLKVGNSNNVQVPSGVIAMWSGVTVPVGWFLCDGQNNTPNLTNRFIIGSGSTYQQGQIGGSVNETITTAHMPGHTHTGANASIGSHAHTVNAVSSNGSHNHNGASAAGGLHNHTVNTDTFAGHSHSINTSAAGGDHNHIVNYNGGGAHSHAGGVQSIFDATGGIYGRNPAPSGSHSLARYPGYNNTRYDNTSGSGNHTHNFALYTTNHAHNANSDTTSGGHTHSFPGAVTAGLQHAHNATPNSSGSHTHANSNTSSDNLHTHNFTTGTAGQGSAFSILPPYYALAFIMKE